MLMPIPVRKERTAASRTLGGLRLLACAGGAFILLTVLLLPRAESTKARVISSVCMDEMHTYFNAARPDETSGLAGEASDDVLDSVEAELMHCLDEMLPFPDPDEWHTLRQDRARFEIFYMDSLFT